MLLHISTGDAVLDSMLEAIAHRAGFVSQQRLGIFSEDTFEEGELDCVIIVGDADAPEGTLYEALLMRYGERCAYLSRPLSIDAAVSAIMRVSVGGVGKGAPSFTYDGESRTVSDEKSSAVLTALEAALFEMLLRAGGEPVSRDKIRAALWSDTDGTNIVDVYISYLKRKLTPILGEGCIVSIRGVGYLLSADVSRQ